MVKKKGKLFWVVLIVVLILLAVLYGLVFKKKFINVNMNDVASGESGASWANNEAEGGVFDSGAVVDAIIGGSGGGSFGGGSGGGDTNTNGGGIVAPPAIPEVDIE